MAVLAVEGGAEGRQLVQGRPEAVDVGPGVELGPAPGLFGAQVAKGADDVAGLRQVATVNEVGEAEIGDPEVARPVDQEVCRLDVAVDDSEVMGMGQRLGGLQGQACRLSRRHDRSRVARPRLVHEARERTPFDESHGVEVNPVLAADLEDRDNVRVIQRRGGLSLDPKPLDLPWVHRGGDRQHLEGDLPAGRDLHSLVDDTHPPAAELANDAVAADRVGVQVELGGGRLRSQQ